VPSSKAAETMSFLTGQSSTFVRSIYDELRQLKRAPDTMQLV
jgi:hypothetical protein